MWKPRNIAFANWLKSTPPASIGAKAFLASRREIRRTPFIPITLFGFVLDENGPERMAAPLDLNGAADAPGAVRSELDT